MKELMSAVMTGSTKRIVAGVLGISIVVLNKKFGLELDATDVIALSTMITGYIVQSGLAAGKVAAAEASAEIKTPSDAAKELGK